MSTPALGRLPAEEVARPLILDNPSKLSQAVLTKLDELISKVNAIAVAIEASTDGDTLQAGLDTAEIKAEIKKLEFFI